MSTHLAHFFQLLLGLLFPQKIQRGRDLHLAAMVENEEDEEAEDKSESDCFSSRLDFRFPSDIVGYLHAHGPVLNDKDDHEAVDGEHGEQEDGLVEVVELDKGCQREDGDYPQMYQVLRKVLMVGVC